MIRRFQFPRVAHCDQGHPIVPGMTVNCPSYRYELDRNTIHVYDTPE